MGFQNKLESITKPYWVNFKQNFPGMLDCAGQDHSNKCPAFSQKFSTSMWVRENIWLMKFYSQPTSLCTERHLHMCPACGWSFQIGMLSNQRILKP